ncbi:MAG: 16S rRNA processing protein RimM [Oscillospiraceae bacterium]|nr:16S rRNA processing protein RimM [Oscillospiraceae bacterium]MBR2896671.1 16S rRNA processing protein RimM [Oscillospiraceae bacterium]MBR2978078.1 16S rRNA processing protein RimM [Oscillospiraceae bacterium]MBR3849021.1 16S rRNA processing protein RimM [Oscillospiraceae bacterium]
MEKERKRYLEAGEIVNTHGLRGEMRVLPWADGPEFLTGFSVFYIDGKPHRAESCRVQKTCVLLKLEGTDDVDAARALRGKTVCIDREDARLPEGSVFVQDLIGLRVIDQNGTEIGEITEVIQLPKHDVYVVRGAAGEYQIPAVKEFIKKTDTDAGTVDVVLIEGMLSDAN